MWSFLQLVLGSYLGPASRTIFALLGALVFSAYIVLDTENLIARCQACQVTHIAEMPRGCMCTVSYARASAAARTAGYTYEPHKYRCTSCGVACCAERYIRPLCLSMRRHDLDDYVAASLSLYLVSVSYSLTSK